MNHHDVTTLYDATPSYEGFLLVVFFWLDFDQIFSWVEEYLIIFFVKKNHNNVGIKVEILFPPIWIEKLWTTINMFTSKNYIHLS